MNLLSDLFGQKIFTNTYSRLLCTMETIIIEKIYTLHDGVCYLVTPKYKIGSRGLYDDMVISMRHSLDPQDIPESIKIIVTSKDNRFGSILNQWLVYWSFCRTFQLLRQSGNHFGFAAAMRQICGKNCLPLFEV